MSTGLSVLFIRASVIYAIAGMALGIHMAATHDHGQMPTHAHLVLLGWVGMTIYAFFYRLWPEAAGGILPKIHAIVANVGLIALIAALYIIYGGDIATGEPIASISSMAVFANTILFAFIVWRGAR
ncbi:MAG: hypothetical protein RJQ21_05860 [Rhodospirillales bacterium]